MQGTKQNHQSGTRPMDGIQANRGSDQGRFGLSCRREFPDESPHGLVA